MKRSWFTYLSYAGIVAILVLIAVLQFYGLRQINDADREKAHKRVQEQADRFASDFNREIQNAYFNFQTGSETWKSKDWTSFNARFDYWREKTNYPDLISDFYFFATDSDLILRYDREKRAFMPIAADQEISTLRTRLIDPKDFRPIYEDIYTLALPIHDTGPSSAPMIIRSDSHNEQRTIGMPARSGVLAIRLNEAVLKEKLIVDLRAKYFGDGEFRSGVVDKNGGPVLDPFTSGAVDASAKLFDLSPDNFIQFANKDVLSSINTESGNDVLVKSRIESHTMKVTDAAGTRPETLQIEVKRAEGPRTTVFTRTSGDGAAWMLQVQHSAGSIDAFMVSTLRRNLAVGFGLLGLLGLSIAAIVFSAQRAKILAQRQVDFVSSVSHEFRTPLAVIYSAGENLADGVAKADGQVSRYGELIKGEGKKLSGMVEQILDFAGANSGRKKYNFAGAQISEVVRDALLQCRPMLEEKGFEVETDIPASLPSIEADLAALSGAIQNLIVNSVKYCNGSRWLRVSASNAGSIVRISVEDHGIGISKSDRRQIFEPFFRSKDVVDAQIHGNGLGLALVRQIAIAHHGKVAVESELGKGSKFTIELPCEKAEK
jgi:signal transduction histidine kinase